MRKAFKEFLIGFLYTFTNDRKGNSARKTTAFALMVCIAYTHYKYLSVDNAQLIIATDGILILVLLGIITAQNLIEMKFGYDHKVKETEDSQNGSGEV
jgi:hypothetical protein